MRRSFIVTVLAVGIVGLFYAAGLGVYAVSSTRPEVSTQPEDADAARESLAALGLRGEYPFESRFVDVPGGRMHYVEEGRGESCACTGSPPGRSCTGTS
jgi:hypothetical protein